MDELVGANQRPRDPYFEYHLFPFGYRHEVQVVCTTAGVGRVLLTFTRNDGAGPFEPKHLRLLDALAPHVAAGVHAAIIRDALDAPIASEVGLIVVNERGRIELANDIGERWLAASSATDKPGRMLAIEVLSALFSRNLDAEDATHTPTLELSDPTSGAAYRLHAEQRLGSDDRPRIVILVEPVRPTERPEALLRLGLTPREAEVAVALLRGVRLADLARELGISPYTAEGHVKHIFEKLCVSSRRELAARLLIGSDRPS